MTPAKKTGPLKARQRSETVEDYLAAVRPDARAVLRKLRLQRARVGQVDHGFVAFDPAVNERARGGEVRALAVELTVPVEERDEVVELFAPGAHDPMPAMTHTVGFPS